MKTKKKAKPAVKKSPFKDNSLLGEWNKDLAEWGVGRGNLRKVEEEKSTDLKIGDRVEYNPEKAPSDIPVRALRQRGSVIGGYPKNRIRVRWDGDRSWTAVVSGYLRKVSDAKPDTSLTSEQERLIRIGKAVENLLKELTPTGAVCSSCRMNPCNH